MAEAVRTRTDFYAVEELLTVEEREVRDRVAEFCRREVLPVVNGYWERAEFPFELVPRFAELGVVGGTLEGYGCPGMSSVAWGLVNMELARADASVQTFYNVHSGLAMISIAMLGSEEQRQRWLPAMARMEQIGAFGLTEPDHGSDPGSMKARAKRCAGGYVLTGNKLWITHAPIADIIAATRPKACGPIPYAQ